MDEISKDKRFSHITVDPRFKRIPNGERKVKIDKRFQSMFNDDKFKVKYTVDKRGRPISYSTNEDLKKYYDLSSEDESDSKEKQDSKNEPNTVGCYVRAPSDVEKSDSDHEGLSDTVKKKLHNSKIDYARGEGNLMSDSSSDDEESYEESDDEGIEHDWGQLDKDAEVTDEITSRLAACNMDWDRIRALDLMVLFNSFLPSGGFIKSVKIYPSEFGLQRMKEEEIKGPLELVSNEKSGENIILDEKDNETEEGSKYHMEKLRQYQLNRLKYYYAIIEFDSSATASKVYSECDNLEYESSATRLDLRFVPDGMVFDQKPKEECDKLPDVSKYQPRYFTTTALQQAKVELTWDEMNPDRIDFNKKLNSGKIEDINENDLQAYLAVSTDSESEEEQKFDVHLEDDKDIVDPINKYKALLENIEKSEEEKKNRNIEMEFTWGVNLKQKTEDLVKKKLTENAELTPFEQYLEKKKEKKKQKKVEKLKKIKEKNNSNQLSSDNSDDEIPSDIDMNNPYFAEEFNNNEFKKKKKIKKRGIENSEKDSEEKRKQEELELLLLSEENNDKKHFSVKQIEHDQKASKSKRWKKKVKKDEIVEDNFEVNVKDDRFSALFSSHHFNIDPADPHFKKTKGMEALIEEKLKRRATNTEGNESPLKLRKNNDGNISEKKLNSELNVLVKSVKTKTATLKKQ